MTFGFGTSPPIYDHDQVIAGLRLMLERGQVTELRALEAQVNPYGRPGTVSGYFDNPDDLVAALRSISTAKGVYFTPNPLNPALLARAANRVRLVFREPLTGDHDILRRKWLLIDCDPIRPAGISSTDAEHAAALSLAADIARTLAAEGWPEPVIADSGNGAHVMFRVDLPADDQGRVANCLTALAARFDTPAVTVDQTVYNPARIWKLPGTLAAKGDNTADRPHRFARIISSPGILAPVLENCLASLGGRASRPTPAAASARSRPPLGIPRRQQAQNGFNLPDWIAAHNLPVVGPTPWRGGQRWIFPVCPWDAQHTNHSAYILLLASGAIAAGCHHAGCGGKRWHDLRDVVEPGWRDRQEESQSNAIPPGVPTAIALEFLRTASRYRGTRR